MAGFKYNWRVQVFLVLIYEELWRFTQICWSLIIEYHLISKNQKLNFVLFQFINILKCVCDFNA